MFGDNSPPARARRVQHARLLSLSRARVTLFPLGEPNSFATSRAASRQVLAVPAAVYRRVFADEIEEKTILRECFRSNPLFRHFSPLQLARLGV